MHKTFLLLFSVIAMLILEPVSGQADNGPMREVRLAIWKKIRIFDPLYTTTPEQIQLFDALFRGLLDVVDGKIEGADAVSWSVSKDGKVYTFNLRDDIFWSDGRPVTAHDYQLAFRRMLNASFDEEPRASYMLTNIKNAVEVEKGMAGADALGVRVLDDKTLQIELTSPASYFLEILTYPGMAPVPAHMVKKHGNDWWKVKPLVSNGPYRLLKMGEGKHITLRKVDVINHPDAPDIAHLIYIASAESAISQMIRDELDIVYDVRPNEFDWIKKRIGYKLLTSVLPSTIYVTINTRLSKFSDKRVRRALFLAIDREAIGRATNSPSSNSFAPRSMFQDAQAHLRDDLLGMNRLERIRKARALLAEAGYTKDNPLEVVIMKTPRPLIGNTALALRSMFAQIGIRTKIEEIAVSDLSPRLVAKNYEVTAANWSADYNDAMTFYAILESTATKNHSAFNNPTYDQLLHQALEEHDGAKRRKIYARLENILREEAPIVPVIHSSYTIVATPSIASVGLSKRERPATNLFLLSISAIKLKEGE